MDQLADLVGILEDLQLHLRLDDPELGNLRVEEAPVRLELGDAVERGTAGHLPGIWEDQIISGLWIRIRINLSCWIRIQEGKNYRTHKNRKKLRIFMF